ncbi:MAG TPA: response regulator transcription factor [Thermoleophilaceae bacterium]|nr:response regulator transcription factor [Thermoleophilaceae bacterium]
MTALQILIADDDADVRRLIVTLLERGGYRALEAADGLEALRLLYARHPAAVVLDVTMPGLDGWQVLERIREVSDVPVLMLTAQGEELSRVRGLRAGADDYVPKPFGRQELLARVEALLRRAGARAAVAEAYRDELLEVDFEQRRVVVGAEPVSLTPLEFRLLGAFVRHPGQLLSRDQLLELAWRDASTRSGDEVKLYVGYLRRKLDAAAGAGAAIETVRGFGYRYRPAAWAGPR